VDAELNTSQFDLNIGLVITFRNHEVIIDPEKSSFGEAKPEE
jgi:hypothetical protein